MEIVVLQKDELDEMIRKAAALAVSNLRDELENSRIPELMDKDDLSRYLKCHRSSINRHMQNGMPFEMCGEHPRFRKSDIDHWLKGEKWESTNDSTVTGSAREIRTGHAAPGTSINA